MGSLQVEKRNAERQHLVTHRKHTNDWKKVSLGPKNGNYWIPFTGRKCLQVQFLEILDFNRKATRTHILEK